MDSLQEGENDVAQNCKKRYNESKKNVNIVTSSLCDMIYKRF